MTATWTKSINVSSLDNLDIYLSCYQEATSCSGILIHIIGMKLHIILLVKYIPWLWK